ncbi:hypothetical protein RQP46_008627 [Phenoliferia psychrophenolica]
MAVSSFLATSTGHNPSTSWSLLFSLIPTAHFVLLVEHEFDEVGDSPVAEGTSAGRGALFFRLLETILIAASIIMPLKWASDVPAFGYLMQCFTLLLALLHHLYVGERLQGVSVALIVLFVYILAIKSYTLQSKDTPSTPNDIVNVVLPLATIVLEFLGSMRQTRQDSNQEG